MKRQRLEKNIERKIVKYLEGQGCVTRKLNGRGFRSWPDRLVLTPAGGHFMLEVKNETGEVTPGQAALHRKLRALGHEVFVVRTLLEGREAFLKYNWHA